MQTWAYSEGNNTLSPIEAFYKTGINGYERECNLADQWERESIPLSVSRDDLGAISLFTEHFVTEM